jgi:hypothetical protein
VKTKRFLGLLCVALACKTQAQSNPPPLNIYTAIELDFLTQTGSIYQVQQSPDLSTWTNFDLPIFGNGNEWSKTYSTRAQSKSFYRITTPVPDSSLVGFYALNGNVYDYSGNTNNGLVSGAIATTDRHGNTNGAFYFSGDGSNYISIPDSPSLDITNAITLTAWFKSVGGGYAQPRILTKGVYQIGLEDTSSSPQIFFDLQPILPGVVTSTNVSLNLNNWVFVVGTYDGQTMKIYINGVLAAQVVQTGSIGINSEPVGIGMNLDDYSDYFLGDISDVRIYNRALSPTEIQQLYTTY